MHKMGRVIQNSPELSILKFLLLNYHHSHFLAATLDFKTFFHAVYFTWGLHLFFTARLFFFEYISLLFVIQLAVFTGFR